MKMLAGYISGIRTDLARVRKRKGKMELHAFESFPSREFSAFASVLKLYLRKHKGDVDVACLGVGGPVIKNQVRPTNLPWNLIAPKIEEKFSFKRLKLVNDIVATAHGLEHLDSDKFFTINKGSRVASGNVGLIAAGTGLGEALVYSDGSHSYPYASEGGHADFAPGSQIETELWGFIYSEKGHVEAEDVLSLSGLVRIYNFLVETQGAVRADWYANAEDPPGMILENALSGEDETSAHAVEIFIDCYASEAGNLALKGMSLGGIYVGGMIAPRILTMLDKGRFMERFVKRGKMGSLLARMPVGVIIDSNAALLGAAGIATKTSV